jgi:Zn-dependent oligopeptidase
MVGNLYFFSASVMKYLKSKRLGYFFSPIIVALFLTQTLFAHSIPGPSGAQAGLQVPLDPYFVIRSDYKPGELLKAAEVAIDKHQRAVEKILSIPPSEKEFSNTVVALDAALAELNAEVNKIGFMKSVSSVEWMISESMAADMKFNEYLSEYYLNSKVLQSIELASGNLRIEEQKRLTRSMEWDLRSRGVFLPDNLKKIAQKRWVELDRELLDFSQAINKDRPTLDFTKAELAGMPERIFFNQL